MLELHEVSVSAGDWMILEGVSIEAREGEVVGVLGPNGAGKSTLLNAIVGRMPVSSGRLEVMGEEWSQLKRHDRIRRGLGFVPEDRGLFANLSIREHLRLLRGNIDQDLLDELFEVFPNLVERRDLRAGSLSGGEQQMLAIARALAGRPRLLLLDEPTLGLAPRIIDDVRHVLQRFARQGRATVVAEQNAVFAAEVCDRMYLLRAGEVQREIGRDERLEVSELLGLTQIEANTE